MPPPAYSESGPKKVLTNGMSPEIVATMAFDKKTKKLTMAELPIYSRMIVYYNSMISLWILIAQ